MGTYLIATDEAGYGPKLGPLMIAGSVWYLPNLDHADERLEQEFQVLRDPVVVDGIKFKVDDSKRIYQSGKGLDVIETMVGAGVRYCGVTTNRFMEVVKWLCPKDYDSVASVPWLMSGNQDDAEEGRVSQMGDAGIKRVPAVGRSPQALTTGPGVFVRQRNVDPDREQGLMHHWFGDDLQLIGLGARVVTAGHFNDFCDRGYNKSDMLSRLTLGLVADLLETVPASEPVSIYCDRHGGRRYYAGVIQDRFSDELVKVSSETKEISCYELSGSRSIRLQFSVKGDRFPPVAYSSIVAKYLRERFMERMNAYFLSRLPEGIKPTAGYPVDANRFLRDIERVRNAEEIPDRLLIRSR